MSGEVLFDNSALSRLFEEPEPERAALVAGLRSLGRLRLTVPNVLESAQIPDDAGRARKLNFYHHVGGSAAPLNAPEEILVMLAQGHAAGRTTLETGDQATHALVEDPSRLTATHLADLKAAMAANEQSFRALHESMRSLLYGTFKASPEDRFRSAASFTRYLASDVRRFLVPFAKEFYEEHAGVNVTPDQARQFVEALPAVCIFALAQAYALWARAIRLQGYGHKKNAGAIDVSSAVYLQYCDRFFTNDVAQFRLLRFVNTINPRRMRVMFYASFRRDILL